LLSNVIEEEACPLSKDQIETYLEKKTRTKANRHWRRREGWNNRQRLESVVEDEVEVSVHPGSPFPPIGRGSLDNDLECPTLLSFVDKPNIRAEFDLAPQPGIDDFFDELESEEVIIGAKRFDRDELGNAQFIEQDAFDSDVSSGFSDKVPVDSSVYIATMPEIDV